MLFLIKITLGKKKAASINPLVFSYDPRSDLPRRAALTSVRAYSRPCENARPRSSGPPSATCLRRGSQADMKNVTVLQGGELLSGGVTRLLSGTLTVGSTLESKRGFGSPKQK